MESIIATAFDADYSLIDGIKRHVDNQYKAFRKSQKEFLHSLMKQRGALVSLQAEEYEEIYHTICEDVINPLNQVMVANFDQYRRTLDLNLPQKLELEIQRIMTRRLADDDKQIQPFVDTKVDEMQRQLDYIQLEQLEKAELLQTVDEAIEFISQEIDHMLRCEPEGAKYWQVDAWKTMEPMTPKQFRAYWDMLLTDVPMTDYKKSEFVRWEQPIPGSNGSLKHIFAGMRQRHSDIKHGIVREADNFGNLYEETWKDGKRHGISREITPAYIFIRLWQEGEKRAELYFDHSFKEIGREDLNRLFEHLQPADLKLKDL